MGLKSWVRSLFEPRYVIDSEGKKMWETEHGTLRELSDYILEKLKVSLSADEYIEVKMCLDMLKIMAKNEYISGDTIDGLGDIVEKVDKLVVVEKEMLRRAKVPGVKILL